MQRMQRTAAIWLCCLAVLPFSASAQVRLAGAVVTPMAAPGATNTIAVTASAPGGVQFNVVPLGTAAGNKPVLITAAWDLVNSLDWITVLAYFDNSIAALQSGLNVIPSSAVSGNYTCLNAKGALYSSGGGPFTSTVLAGTGPNASLQLMRQNINGNWKTHCSCTLNLSISLAGRPTQAAGTYSGTLHIVVQATP